MKPLVSTCVGAVTSLLMHGTLHADDGHGAHPSLHDDASDEKREAEPVPVDDSALDALRAGEPTDASAPVDSSDKPSETRWFFDFTIGAGGVLAFTDPLTTGHLVWGGVYFHWDDFAIGIALAGTYPGSRVQTRFGSVAIDGRWYFAGTRDALRPFAVMGLGFSSNDALDGRTPGPDVVRWAGMGSVLNVSPGLGLRWGNDSGFFLQAEARTVNFSHAVFALGGGFAF